MKHAKKRKEQGPYKDIIDFAFRQLGEGPDEGWDLATDADLKRFEERCSRRVYKSTACGAWLAFVRCAPVEDVMRVFRVCLADGVRGTEITQVREGENLLGESEWPEEFKQFMCLKTWTGLEDWFQPLAKIGLEIIWGIASEKIESNQEGSVRVERREHSMVLRVQVKCRKENHREKPAFGVYGIHMGSIVEGSSEVDGGDLMFPFTEDQYESVITDVESECDRLWHEANDPEEE